jgi:D-alanyl-D-alanine dipeptidase
MKCKKILYACLLVLPFYANLRAQSLEALNTYLEGTNQVLYVTTDSCNATTGILTLYERKNGKTKWKCITSYPVSIGRSGLARDENSTAEVYFPQKTKHEGDGNSPAGIFRLGPVFSYHQLKGLNMPFQLANEALLCVDDVNSKYYNQLVLSDSISGKDFASYEKMKRSDEQYEYGVWVQYNDNPVIPGNGSCIFLHVWHHSEAPTSGCTAMSREHMLALIYRLNKKMNPMLVQICHQP